MSRVASPAMLERAGYRDSIDNHVEEKIKSNGMGMPRSQSKIYPVAATSVTFSMSFIGCYLLALALGAFE
jgi:hypothetical protein